MYDKITYLLNEAGRLRAESARQIRESLEADPELEKIIYSETEPRQRRYDYLLEN